jgi:hypothetical protein
VTRDNLIGNSAHETIEAFAAAFYGLFCAALGFAVWPMMIVALNAIAWVINELVRSN